MGVGRRRMSARSHLSGLCLWFALLFCALSPAWADFDVQDQSPGVHPTRPRFLAEAGSVLGDDGPQVTIQFEIPYAELFFQPVGARFRSTLDVIFVLYRDGIQVGGDFWNEEVRVLDFADTRDRTATVSRAHTLAAEPGRHTVEVVVSEFAAGRESRLEWPIEVPDYQALPLSISSLWVVDSPDSGRDVQAPPQGRVLPRRFGEPLGPKAVVGELYRPSPGTEPARLVWRVYDARGESKQEGELAVPAALQAPFLVRPDLTRLWLGSYTFELKARADGLEARRRFEFQIEASAGAFDSDLEQSLELIELIAEPGEVDDLRDLPPGERKEAWNRFWKKRDPTPGTPENEFRENFFERVRYANEHYSVLEPGWRSDRGKTYIRYGPPDEVESRPYNLDGPPYEVWTYVKLGRQFVFVDYDGFGRYQFHQPGRF